MLMRVEKELEQGRDVEAFIQELRKILRILESYKPIPDEQKYHEYYSLIRQRLETLNRINKEIEERALRRFRSTRSINTLP